MVRKGRSEKHWQSAEKTFTNEKTEDGKAVTLSGASQRVRPDMPQFTAEVTVRLRKSWTGKRVIRSVLFHPAA